MDEKKINWLENAVRMIEAEDPRLQCCSQDLAERLSALLLERLPAAIGATLLGLLPEHELAPRPGTSRALAACAHAKGETSIGFPDFVERAGHVVGCSNYGSGSPARAQRIAEVFLWSFANPLPPDLKEQMLHALPAELHRRMNLVTTPADESKVA